MILLTALLRDPIRDDRNILLHVSSGRLPELQVIFLPFVVVLAIARVFQLYLGGNTMYEMRRRKPDAEPTLLPTQRIFNLPHHICMV